MVLRKVMAQIVLHVKIIHLNMVLAPVIVLNAMLVILLQQRDQDQMPIRIVSALMTHTESLIRIVNNVIALDK